jgi:hypothetical protein
VGVVCRDYIVEDKGCMEDDMKYTCHCFEDIFVAVGRGCNTMVDKSCLNYLQEVSVLIEF